MNALDKTASPPRTIECVLIGNRSLQVSAEYGQMRFPIVLSLVCLLACSQETTEKSIEAALVRAGGVAELSATPASTSLPPSELLSAATSFGMPYRLWSLREYLLVADQARGPTLHIVNGTTGALLRSVGRWGRGPGEFQSVVAVDTVAGTSGIVSLYDYNQQRTTMLSIDSLLSKGIHVLGTKRLDSRPESMTLLPDGRLVVANASDSAVLQIIDSSGRSVEYLSVPAIKVPPADSPFLRSAYKARVCGSRDGQVALAFRFTSSLAIVDVTSKRDVAASVPHAFRPSFIETPLVGKRMFKGGAPGVRYAYIDCVATANAIYALFSGRLIGKYDRARDNAGQYVHRFDWSGRLTSEWKLDHDAFALAISHSMLLTVAVGDVPSLRRTRLPESGLAMESR